MNESGKEQKHDEIMNAIGGVWAATGRLSDLRHRIKQNTSPPPTPSEDAVEQERTLENVLDRLPKDLTVIREEIDNLINEITASLF